MMDREYDIISDKNERIRTLEVQVTEANTELSDQRKTNADLIVIVNKQFAAITKLEAELAAVNTLVSDAVKAMEILKEQGRLQRALDRIKKAGCVPNLGYSVEYGGIFEVEVTVRAFGPPGDEWRLGEEHLFCAFSDAKAAEQAADWAESQKEGKA